MKITMHGLFLVLFSFLQGTLINYIEIFNIKPNLFLVYIIVVCCFCERTEGGVVGFAFGFTLDLLIGKIWGIYALVAMICGFFISSFCKKVLRKSNILVTFIFIFFGTVVMETIYYVVSLLFRENYDFFTAFFKVILLEGAYNVLISVPVYLVLSFFAKRLYVDKGEIIG